MFFKHLRTHIDWSRDLNKELMKNNLLQPSLENNSLTLNSERRANACKIKITSRKIGEGVAKARATLNLAR